MLCVLSAPYLGTGRGLSSRRSLWRSDDGGRWVLRNDLNEACQRPCDIVESCG